MPRCAVSMASATPRPRSQTCSRKAMVLSQSTAAESHGSLSAKGSVTGWTAENAMRFNGPSTFAGNVREAATREVSIERSAFGSLSDKEDMGWMGLFIVASSDLDRGDVDPAPLLPALQSAFGELHALDALEQRELVRRILVDMADEHLPLLLE